MADWKQITARIRRARTSKEPAAQLSNLYEKTRDAMVAFELAKFFEMAGQNADASKWYAAAAERFRRADWKIKAQEAAVRLGGEPSAVNPDAPAPAPSESAVPVEQNVAMLESVVAVSSEAQAAAEDSADSPSSSDKKHRRRGRRGGRNRKKVGAPGNAGAAPRTQEVSAPLRGLPPAAYTEPAEPVSVRASHTNLMPQLPVEPVADAGGANVRGRYGDPGLSSRISLLEMQFRRLMTCTPVKLNEADMAPVGPGVFVLTDSDLTSCYYVEACQTLRIAVGNLLRGGTSRRGTDSIKQQLAEHLGIAEARVPKYLADHCVVRWLQLDEGASHFAHFAIAVLRPTLNE